MAATEVGPQAEQARKARRLAGQYIRGLRTDAGLTQRDLAQRLGLEYYTFVSQVELGHNRVPAEAQKAWAKALGVPVEEFAKKLLSYYEPHTFAALFGK